MYPPKVVVLYSLSFLYIFFSTMLADCLPESATNFQRPYFLRVPYIFFYGFLVTIQLNFVLVDNIKLKLPIWILFF